MGIAIAQIIRTIQDVIRFERFVNLDRQRTTAFGAEYKSSVVSPRLNDVDIGLNYSYLIIILLFFFLCV